MRNYDDIVRRVEGLSQPHVQRRVLGDVEGHPVFGVTLSSGDAELPTALIIGGTHGDEPAGVEAALAFLSRDLGPWLDALRFEVIPCFNPYGYVHNTRHTRQDVDINWAYKRDDVPEIQVVRTFLAGRRFVFVVDFHEDWESATSSSVAESLLAAGVVSATSSGDDGPEESR